MKQLARSTRWAWGHLDSRERVVFIALAPVWVLSYGGWWGLHGVNTVAAKRRRP
jgi:hypothetical protein